MLENISVEDCRRVLPRLASFRRQEEVTLFCTGPRLKKGKNGKRHETLAKLEQLVGAPLLVLSHPSELFELASRRRKAMDVDPAAG